MKENLYKHINPSDNILISELSLKERKDLINLIDNTPINYKEKLNVPSNITFGLEIEFEQAGFIKTFNELKQYCNIAFYDEMSPKEYNNWTIEFEQDCSRRIENILYGGEINSPIVNNNIDFFKELKNVCNVFKNNNAQFNSKAGLHIHISKDIMKHKIKDYLKLLKTWIIFEDEFLKLYNGDKHIRRKSAETYAMKLERTLYSKIFEEYKNYKLVSQIEKKLQFPRFYDIAFYTPRVCNKTFELRACNGTDNEIIIQQYINYFFHLFKLVSNSESNDFIDNLFVLYENDKLEVTQDTMFKLFDYMFDNIEDKASTLRLYYKNTEYSRLTNI